MFLVVCEIVKKKCEKSKRPNLMLHSCSFPLACKVQTLGQKLRAVNFFVCAKYRKGKLELSIVWRLFLKVSNSRSTAFYLGPFSVRIGIRAVPLLAIYGTARHTAFSR